MGKKMDDSITTVGDFKYATRNAKDDTQIYLEYPDSLALLEITEIMMQLSKNENERSCVILRAR